MVTPRFLCEGEERFGGFLRDEGQVDVFSGEGPLVGAAEQEQCFGEVDRPGVDGVEAVDELAVVAVRILAGHVEQRLRDRQRGAQFVGGVGGEPLLFGDVRFEAREHGVEGVGEFAELVAAALAAGCGGRAIRSRPVRVASVMRASGASIWPARSHPPTQAEHQQERQHDGRLRSESAQEVGAAGDRRAGSSGDAHAGRGRSAGGTPTRRRAARHRRA